MFPGLNINVYIWVSTCHKFKLLKTTTNHLYGNIPFRDIGVIPWSTTRLDIGVPWTEFFKTAYGNKPRKNIP